MLMDEYPEFCSLGPKSLKGSPVTIHLYVENDRCRLQPGSCSRCHRQNAEWRIPSGVDRYGVLEDPFGHSWSIATHIRDLSPEEIRAGAQKNVYRRSSQIKTGTQISKE